MQPVGGGFSGAQVWRIEVGDAAYALRAWPPQGLPITRLCGLHRLLRFVHQQGVTAVPVPLATRNGETVVQADGRQWQLEPWMPGTADFADHPTPIRLQRIMQCLADWHRAAARFIPRAGEETWFASAEIAVSPGVIERSERIEFWSPERVRHWEDRLRGRPPDESTAIGLQILQGYRQAAPRVQADLRNAAALRVPLQPCLRDVWHDHLLLTGDEVTGLIDAGACRAESVAADLARLLGSFFEDDRQRWSEALEIYQQHRPLSMDELRLVEVFDRSTVLLSGMAWLEWLLMERRRFAEPQRVHERLKTIVRRLQALAMACVG